MRAIIVGCGRVGSRLARQLQDEGHEVTVIDEKPSAFGRLGEEFAGRMMIGTGNDVSVLRRAGIEHCDAFASVTNGDNRNIMAAQIARELFNVKRVITRIYDPIREEAYRSLGMETLCTTSISAGIMHDFFTTGSNRAHEAQHGDAGESGTAAPP